MLEINECPKCKIKLVCIGGRSAHYSNWYCPMCDYPEKKVENLRCTIGELRARVAALTVERDKAWQELRVIRELIQADPEESTADEIGRLLYRIEGAK